MNVNDLTKIVLFRHPVPTGFGRPAMHAVVLAATNSEPAPDTLYVAHAMNEKVLIAVCFDSQGFAYVGKTYCNEGSFDVGLMLRNHTGRGPFQLSKSDYAALFSMRLDAAHTKARAQARRSKAAATKTAAARKLNKALK